MDIKNDYFDKDRLEDMVDEIIIEDEDADRHIIEMALQQSSTQWKFPQQFYITMPPSHLLYVPQPSSM